jgi:hypothetical protein
MATHQAEQHHTAAQLKKKKPVLEWMGFFVIRDFEDVILENS